MGDEQGLRRIPPDHWLELIEDPNAWTPPSPLPGPVATERLLIRPYVPADAPALFEAVRSSLDRILPWMVWAMTDHQQESDSLYFIERSRRAAESPDCIDFPLGIFDRSSGRYLGGCGFHRIVRGLLEAEVGYWIRGDAQGQGYCTEAVGALMSSGFMPQDRGGWGFRRIVIFNAADNPASRRVCEKLRLRLERRERQSRYVGALQGQQPLGYLDHLGYGVLQDEWDFDSDRAREGIGWGDSAP